MWTSSFILNFACSFASKGKRIQWTFALDLSFNHQHEFMRYNCSSFDSIEFPLNCVHSNSLCCSENVRNWCKAYTFKIDVTLSSNNRNESTQLKTIAAIHFHRVLHVIKWVRFSILFWILQLCFAAEYFSAVSFHSLMISWKMNYPPLHGYRPTHIRSHTLSSYPI